MSVIALRRAVTAVVLQVPGVPSLEGPNNVCVSGLVKGSHMNYEWHWADTGASLLQCIFRCKRAVNKSWWWWCCPQAQLFSQVRFHGFMVSRNCQWWCGFPHHSGFNNLLNAVPRWAVDIQPRARLWQGPMGLRIAMPDPAHAHSNTCLRPRFGA